MADKAKWVVLVVLLMFKLTPSVPVSPPVDWEEVVSEMIPEGAVRGLTPDQYLDLKGQVLVPIHSIDMGSGYVHIHDPATGDVDVVYDASLLPNFIYRKGPGFGEEVGPLLGGKKVDCSKTVWVGSPALQCFERFSETEIVSERWDGSEWALYVHRIPKK